MGIGVSSGDSGSLSGDGFVLGTAVCFADWCLFCGFGLLWVCFRDKVSSGSVCGLGSFGGFRVCLLRIGVCSEDCDLLMGLGVISLVEVTSGFCAQFRVWGRFHRLGSALGIGVTSCGWGQFLKVRSFLEIGFS